MAVVLIIIALILIVSAVRGQTALVADTLKSDMQSGFSSAGNFGAWLVVMLVLSGIGSIKALKAPADAMIVLILIVFLLRNGGFFDKLFSAFE